jgi:hypothetical protein
MDLLRRCSGSTSAFLRPLGLGAVVVLASCAGPPKTYFHLCKPPVVT